MTTADIMSGVLGEGSSVGDHNNVDLLIAVMGSTGVGKSTFIKTVTENEHVKIGHGLRTGI